MTHLYDRIGGGTAITPIRSAFHLSVNLQLVPTIYRPRKLLYQETIDPEMAPLKSQTVQTVCGFLPAGIKHRAVKWKKLLINLESQRSSLIPIVLAIRFHDCSRKKKETNTEKLDLKNRKLITPFVRGQFHIKL